MPAINADDGCPLNVEVEGREGAPVLMLSNSLGTNLHMWDDQAPEFAKHFRLVRYDRRGHGNSGVPKGPYSMERFGRDVLSIIDALKIKTINWCGLSMGGMVGQWLGANASNRIDKLVLSNTNFNYADKAPWSDRITFVREKGLRELVGPNMERWFTKDFRARAPQAINRMTEMFVATNPAGYTEVRSLISRHVAGADVCDDTSAGRQQDGFDVGRDRNGDAHHRADGWYLPHARGARSGLEIFYSRQRRHCVGALRYHSGLHGGAPRDRGRGRRHGLDHTDNARSAIRSRIAQPCFCFPSAGLRHQGRACAAACLATRCARRRTD